jgi:hypothetical protein
MDSLLRPDAVTAAETIIAAVLTHPLICAWCPGFVPADPVHRGGVSHGMCPACQAIFSAQIDALDGGIA